MAQDTESSQQGGQLPEGCQHRGEQQQQQQFLLQEQPTSQGQQQRQPLVDQLPEQQHEQQVDSMDIQVATDMPGSSEPAATTTDPAAVPQSRDTQDLNHITQDSTPAAPITVPVPPPQMPDAQDLNNIHISNTPKPTCTPPTTAMPQTSHAQQRNSALAATAARPAASQRTPAPHSLAPGPVAAEPLPEPLKTNSRYMIDHDDDLDIVEEGAGNVAVEALSEDEAVSDGAEGVSDGEGSEELSEEGVSRDRATRFVSVSRHPTGGFSLGAILELIECHNKRTGVFQSMCSSQLFEWGLICSQTLQVCGCMETNVKTCAEQLLWHACECQCGIGRKPP